MGKIRIGHDQLCALLQQSQGLFQSGQGELCIPGKQDDVGPIVRTLKAELRCKSVKRLFGNYMDARARTFRCDRSYSQLTCKKDAFLRQRQADCVQFCR